MTKKAEVEETKTATAAEINAKLMDVFIDDYKLFGEVTEEVLDELDSVASVILRRGSDHIIDVPECVLYDM